FEGAEKKDLCEVQKHNRDHEIRSPVMHRAEKPTQLLLVVQVFKTGVSLGRRGLIHQCETDTGDNLDHETEQRPNAEHVEPAGGPPRYSVARRCVEDPADVETLINPERDVSESFNHNHHPNSDWLGQRRKLTSFNPKLSVLDFVFVLV